MKTTGFSLTRSKDASYIYKKERIIKRVNRVTVCWDVKQQIGGQCLLGGMVSAT